jgi:hypothetical protein
LAVFPEDEPIPLQVASELWGLGGSNSRRLAVKLATASLLEFNPAAGQIRLQDVLRTFLGQTLGQAALAQAQAGLIDAWGNPPTSCPTPTPGAGSATTSRRPAAKANSMACYTISAGCRPSSTPPASPQSSSGIRPAANPNPASRNS